MLYFFSLFLQERVCEKKRMSAQQISLFLKQGVNFAKRNTVMFARWGAFAGVAALYLVE